MFAAVLPRELEPESDLFISRSRDFTVQTRGSGLSRAEIGRRKAERYGSRETGRPPARLKCSLFSVCRSSTKSSKPSGRTGAFSRASRGVTSISLSTAPNSESLSVCLSICPLDSMQRAARLRRRTAGVNSSRGSRYALLPAAGDAAIRISGQRVLGSERASVPFFSCDD